MRKRAVYDWPLILIVLAVVSSCTAPEIPSAPRSLAADQIAASIRSLPKHAHFSLSGLAFFKQKLYVSTNVGLLVVDDSKPVTLYKWFDSDDVVEGPWVDIANDSLWIQHAHDNSLWRFDGSTWHKLALPVPPEGFTRGDILKGFLGINSPSAFWLVGGRHAWRFQPADSSWVEEPQPPAPPFSSIRAVAPGEAMLYIVDEVDASVPPSEYAVYNRDNNWARQDLSKEMDFGGIVTNSEGTFIRAVDGRIFSIRSEKIEVMDTPGHCEAIAQTSMGELLASFVGRGIFALDRDKWVLRVPYPYGKEEGDHWARLAESNGQIAYATSSVPQIQPNDTFTYTGSGALWIQRGNKLERVPL